MAIENRGAKKYKFAQAEETPAMLNSSLTVKLVLLEKRNSQKGASRHSPRECFKAPRRERTGPFGWCGTCASGGCKEGGGGGDPPGVQSGWGFCEEHCLLFSDDASGGGHSAPPAPQHAEQLNEIGALTMLSPSRWTTSRMTHVLFPC